MNTLALTSAWESSVLGDETLFHENIKDTNVAGNMSILKCSIFKNIAFQVSFTLLIWLCCAHRNGIWLVLCSYVLYFEVFIQILF